MERKRFVYKCTQLSMDVLSVFDSTVSGKLRSLTDEESVSVAVSFN